MGLRGHQTKIAYRYLAWIQPDMNETYTELSLSWNGRELNINFWE